MPRLSTWVGRLSRIGSYGPTAQVRTPTAFVSVLRARWPTLQGQETESWFKAPPEQEPTAQPPRIKGHEAFKRDHKTLHASRCRAAHTSEPGYHAALTFHGPRSKSSQHALLTVASIFLHPRALNRAPRPRLVLGELPVIWLITWSRTWGR